jgi:small subunit ribosomal protein S3
MGQKVNPNGYRMGITQNYVSRWFFSNKTQYRVTLLADLLIREELQTKYKYASVTQVVVERAINKITVTLFSVKPGMIIGRGGKGLEEIKTIITKHTKLKKTEKTKIDIKIEPIKKPFLEAYYVGQQISEKLARNMSHRSVIHQMMSKVMEAGAKGIKVQVGGRINGAEIARREKYFEGSVPTSTIREDVTYVNYPALTKSGYVGVKVWICK